MIRRHLAVPTCKAARHCYPLAVFTALLLAVSCMSCSGNQQRPDRDPTASNQSSSDRQDQAVWDVDFADLANNLQEYQDQQLRGETLIYKRLSENALLIGESKKTLILAFVDDMKTSRVRLVEGQRIRLKGRVVGHQYAKVQLDLESHVSEMLQDRPYVLAISGRNHIAVLEEAPSQKQDEEKTVTIGDEK